MIGETEEDARGAVQLGHDHTLGTVDDKGAAGSHIGNHAQIDILNAGFKILVLLVRAGEFQFCFQGNAVGQTSFQTLVHGIAWSLYGVVKELEDEGASGICNREVLGESTVQALVLATLCFGVYLKELLERLELDIQEVRIFNRSGGCKTYSLIIIICQGCKFFVEKKLLTYDGNANQWAL